MVWKEEQWHSCALSSRWLWKPNPKPSLAGTLSAGNAERCCLSPETGARIELLFQTSSESTVSRITSRLLGCFCQQEPLRCSGASPLPLDNLTAPPARNKPAAGGEKEHTRQHNGSRTLCSLTRVDGAPRVRLRREETTGRKQPRLQSERDHRVKKSAAEETSIGRGTETGSAGSDGGSGAMRCELPLSTDGRAASAWVCLTH
ncbi:unnamed protein product [Pleuronectes platessa]|uniref:Uncharacterized protein n=1 Tax=Pleuronectes platessa TaxID=8262 RepID=A0A9N7TZV3_PLEPL|nr:unnamed protein product [Pleuronectes platessa]